LKPTGLETKEAVKIDQATIVRRIEKVRAFALFQIDDDPKSIEQNMFGNFVEDFCP
jgi:hypothetical protein